MDFTAIKQAKGEELLTIGQLRKGDVLALRAFVKGKPNKAERDEKKRKLLETLKGKLPRKKSKSKSKVEKAKEIKEDPKIAHRKVLIGWQHFDKAKNKYVCVGSLKAVAHVISVFQIKHRANEACFLS